MHDTFGNTVTALSTTALAHYDRAVDAHLHALPGVVESLDAALIEAPDLALAHALKALTRLAQGRGADARESIGSALQSGHRASERERSHVALIATIVEGRGRDALVHVIDHAARHPTDLLAASTALGAYGLFAFSGRNDHNEARLAFTESLAAHVPDDMPWMLSYRGWARIEAGEVDEGLAMARRAIAIRSDNAHNAHAVMHGLYEKSDPEGGLSFIDDWLSGYPEHALMWGHLQWHAALDELALGQDDAALTRLLGPITRYLEHARPFMSMIDLASLLWRLGLRGIRALPWTDARAYAERHFAGGSNPFGEVHLAMLAAACADRAALDAIGQRLEAHRDRGHEGARAGLEWVQGLRALIDGNAADAQAYLDACSSEAVRLGGSHAQRGVIDETRRAKRCPSIH